MAKPQQARAQQTRESIVRAAAEIFDRFGYGTATLGDVIAHADVTKGALYFHFKSKEELAQAVIEREHEMAIALGRELLAQNASGLVSAIRSTKRLARLLIDDVIVRGGIRLTLEAGSFDLPVDNPYKDWIDTLASLMERAIQEGDIRPDVSPQDLGQYIAASFTGTQLVSQVLTGRTDLMHRVNMMWDLLLPSLVPARKLPYFRSMLNVDSPERSESATG